MDKYIVAMLQSKGALYNDFFKSEQNCKKMSLITTKIIKWRAEDQNKLFDEEKDKKIHYDLIVHFLTPAARQSFLDSLNATFVCVPVNRTEELYRSSMPHIKYKTIAELLLSVYHHCSPRSKKMAVTNYVKDIFFHFNIVEIGNPYILEVCKMSSNVKNMLAQYNNTAENMEEQFRAQNMNLQTFQDKIKLNLGVEVTVEQGCCKGMTRDQDLGHDPVIYQAEAYAQAMMRAQAVRSINDILQGIAIPFTVFDQEALFKYMQVVGKKLATAAKMNVAIKAFSMRALFSEEIVDATKATGAIDRKLVTHDIKDHFHTACLNVFVMLQTEGDSIFDNIDDFRFVTHQKLVEVDISKANGKTIVPVIHKHIKKVALRCTAVGWGDYTEGSLKNDTRSARKALRETLGYGYIATREPTTLKCYRCGGTGHMVKTCPFPGTKQQAYETRIATEKGTTGHEGVDHTYHAIKQVVTWPGMYDNICHFVHTCPIKKQDKFYNGKYKGHVVKIQVVINNQGIPMDVQGLYKGVRHDLKIWQN
eukprot:m51a1_g10390 hypothetical protein (533) ;mRNA; r:28066-46081